MGEKKGNVEQMSGDDRDCGGYPKPRDIFRKSGRELLDKVGIDFYDL